MKYVLDSSIGFKWVVTEPLSDKALLVREDYRNTIHELIAPDIFPVEVAHALTRAERQGRIAVPKSAILLADVLTTAPILYSYLPLLARACEISSAKRVGVYDCVYVALAERERCEFITADDRILKNLQPVFTFIVHLSSVP
jgi:predicted nucleic acid-binding protein